MKKTFILLTILLACSFVACSEDDDKDERTTNFDVPELTADNAIQYTVTTPANGRAYVLLDGGKIAVDWGDGIITKDMNPGKGEESWRTEFTHTYKKGGDYRIRVWSEEINFINLSSLTQIYTQLSIGNCPMLERAMLNSFSKEKTLNLNTCPKLQWLNLGNWASLEAVALDQCLELQSVDIYTNPNLKKMDLSKNTKLELVSCTYNGIAELLMPASVVNFDCQSNNIQSITMTNNQNLRGMNCSGNRNLTTIDLEGCTNLSSLGFSQTQVSDFDFSVFENLVAIYCNESKLQNVNVSKNEDLIILSCTGLGLASLDISENLILSHLDCSNNKLTALDVSKNKDFRELLVNDNQLGKNAVEIILKDLPKFDPNTAKSAPPKPQPSQITIYDNPGAETCDIKIITDKGWVVKQKPNMPID